MCENCGCSQSEEQTTYLIPGEQGTSAEKTKNLGQHHIKSHDHDHHHEHGHHHNHDLNHHTHDHHSHEHVHSHTIDLEIDILQKNNLMAERNRGFFEAKNIRCFNFVSSPGSGKTTLLEKTIPVLQGKNKIYVVEGDQQTSLDAERMYKTGAKSIQINTGNGCHLDATMVNNAVKKLQPDDSSFIFIENVGNLVCPALFDLGEHKRVLLVSVTEGEDKPLKYPVMFEKSHLCLINKTDLLPYVDFNTQKFKEYALRINHHLRFIEISATKGDGMNEWLDWMKNMLK